MCSASLCHTLSPFCVFADLQDVWHTAEREQVSLTCEIVFSFKLERVLRYT